MKYISLCDGIGAAHVAWQGIGWKCLAVAEIDSYCNAVVGHHFGFPNLGDITKLTKERILEYGKPDLIIGGTPCQSFSCAGKREGTASPDGQLIYTFVDIVQTIKPRWIIWENVYGVLSSDNGDAFASFVHYLAQCGYGLAWRVLDAQFFGVPQRRRRVFLVGCLGNPAGAGKVLFESQCLPWYPPPGRSAREIDPRTIANCLRAQGQLAHRLDVDTVVVDKVAYTLRRRNESGLRVGIDNMVVDTMTRKWAKGSGGPAGDECQNLVAVPIAEVGKRTGRSTRNPSHGIGIGKDGDPMYTLQASARHAVACLGNGKSVTGTLQRNCGKKQWIGNQEAFSGDFHVVQKVAPTLTASDGGPNDFTPIIADTLTKNWIRSKGAKAGNNAGVINPIAGDDLDVRRLTPRECERLQGFPDDYTLVPVKTTKAGKVVYMSDTQRYMMLGNSMATPVIEWIGRRLETVHHQTYGGSMPKKTTKKAAKEKPLDKSYCAFFDEYKLGTNIVGCAHPDDGGFIADDLCRKCTKRQRPVSLSMKRAIDANPEGAAKFAEGLFPPKKPVKKKTAKKTTKAKRESPEVMKQRQLDAAYSLRNELQERIRKFTDDISPAKKGIAEETNLQRSIETLLYDPLYAPDESEPPKENEIVKKFLVSRLESSVGTTEALKGQLSEIAKITADDRMKLKKVNERIHRLHTVGPDPQQEFDMEDEQ